MSATIVWSVVPIGIKYLLSESLAPFTIAFTRFALASSALLLAAHAGRATAAITSSAFPILLMGGLGMAGNYTLYALGLRYTTASATNIIVQNEVVALVILSHFFLGERIGAIKVIGMSAAIIGIAVVFWNGQSMEALFSSQNLMGNGIIFIAGLSWAFYALAQKMLSRRGVSNINGLARIFGISAAVTFIPALLTFQAPDNLSFAVVMWFLVIGVVCTGFGYVLLARAFDRLSASTVGVVTCMLPIFTLLMARMFLNETLTWGIAVGAAFVVGGIILIGREEAISGEVTSDRS